MNQNTAGRMTRETFWYPVAVATGLIGTVAAVTAVLIRLPSAIVISPLGRVPRWGASIPLPDVDRCRYLSGRAFSCHP
ncbi:hypothetical protein C1884_21280 [Pseudomonas sp. GW460-R15]|nr:hypothetical protein C1887_07125 [Pseudomonas sp. GW456-R21]POA64371.1 hypothetical protein C1884_21280 [Pseudomonas sp. GW460-R15]